MKTITKPDDMPITGLPQFSVLEFTKIYIPGDERSRTHPGHGYPATTEDVSRLMTFESAEDLADWIRHNDGARYIVLRAERLNVETRTVVDIGTANK